MRSIYLILLLIIFSAQLQSQNIKWISASGNDSNNGDSPATPYRTINHALGEILPGDALHFDGAGGRFDLDGVDETIGASSSLDATANQPTKFIGVNNFEFYNSGSFTAVNLRIVADHIVFDNINFDGGRAGTVFYMIVQIDDQESSGDAHHVTFLNCEFKNNAIISQRSNTTGFIPNVKINHCSFSKNRLAIDFNEATYRGDLGSDITVTNCSFYGDGVSGGYAYTSYGSSGAGLDVWKRNIVEGFHTVFRTESTQWMVTGGHATDLGDVSLYYDYTTFDNEGSLSIQSRDIDGVDPLFLDKENNDLRLKAGSPAINAASGFVTLGYKRRIAINASY